MMRIVLTIAAAAAITMGVASQASASDITWSKAVDETGRPTDVVTGGAFFAAVTAGGSTTVNGVKFVGQTQSKTAGLILFGSAPIKVEAVQNNYDQYGTAPAKWDPGYRLLVSGGAYSETPSPMKIQISGLTVGKTYVVQIFEAFWNANYPTEFAGGQRQSSALNLSGDARPGSSASSTAQYVTGTFVADSESESISLTSSTAWMVFDAIQVRDMGVAIAGK